jgi:uncharacterized protein (TIGR01777 family)
VRRVLVSGVSGPIGAALLPSLESQGTEIVRLVRAAAKGEGQISWDPSGRLAPETASGFDAVIHLAGESVVGRWTDAKKKAIHESRVLGTRSVATALSETKEKPRVLVCASAIGFYGNRGDEVLTEESPGGSGFPADLSRDWETESGLAAQAGIRTVNLRIGLVLSDRGGALDKMVTPFKLGLGGRLGPGTQWWSWIHVDDIVGAIHHILRTESLAGPVNLVAPNPVRNEEFTRALASVLGRPALLPMPAFAARLAFGEMAQELMLSSQRVKPAKLEGSGFAFQYPELRGALEDLVG